MKTFLLLTFFAFTIQLINAQSVHGKFEISPVDNPEIRMINDLNDIEMIRFVVVDSISFGQCYFVYITEYEKGTIVAVDSLVNRCVLNVPIVLPGGDSALYKVNMCDYIRRRSGKDYYLMLGGQQKDSVLELAIHYPMQSFQRELRGYKDYVLRPLNCTGPESKILEGERKNIVSYAPPVKIASNASSYCLLDSEKPLNWHEKFKLEHYYVISVELKKEL